MEATSLGEIYASINKDADTIYVVPLIRYSHKETDYLYLLYEDLINDKTFKIKSISVFDHFKIVAGILSNKKAILHYHWLEFQDFKSLLGMPWKMLCIFLFQLLGGNIVWTLHNEFPHDQEYPGLHKFLHIKMAEWSDILHVHCQRAVSIMSEKLQASPEKFRLIPHPDFPASSIPRLTAIENLNSEYQCKLNDNSKVLLMFGNISQYKQLDDVADVVMSIESESKLIIAGPIKKGNMNLYDELKKKAEKSSRVVLIPNFIPEKHVSWFYSAADICVFNYREILSSGGYNMAQAYNKTIVAPDLGCLSENRDTPGTYLFNDQNELEDLLIKLLTKLPND